VGVPLGRQTATPWLAMGAPVLPRAWAAHACMHGAPQRSAAQRARLGPQLTAALEAHHRLAHPSRRRTPGQAGPPGKLVKAEDPTSAPRCTGTSTGPAPYGRKPGMIAAPAAGGLRALPLLGGHPREASDVAPVVDHGE
jgi:hypothetical protein